MRILSWDKWERLCPDRWWRCEPGAARSDALTHGEAICVRTEWSQQSETGSGEESILVSEALVPDLPKASFSPALLGHLSQ